MNEAVHRSGLRHDEIQEAIMGNVLTANVGQAPCRQAALRAGFPTSLVCTTINKVCASGMKSVMLGAQTIMTGANKAMIAGGMESMSNTPYYLAKARRGYNYGHDQLLDGVLVDGLWDPTDNHHMGNCAEICAEKMGFSREEQDRYAIESYKRSIKAWETGLFTEETVPVTVPSKGGQSKVVKQDEECAKLREDKIPKLRPAFKVEGGTVTAANASKINDGAAALILASEEFATSRNLKPMGRILGFADAALAPVDFTIAPSHAVPRALAHAGISLQQVDYFEFNEAFSVVSLANMKLLGLDSERVNVNGGAVALGHPIGASGARIIVSLLHILKNRKARIGVAAICNGGGGASAVVVERNPEWE